MALFLPAAPESDVRQTDTCPSEDGRQSGEGKHPVECVLLKVRPGEESQKTKCRCNADRYNGSSSPVNIRENLGSLALFGKSCESSRATVDGGVAYGEDCDQNDGVENGR